MAFQAEITVRYLDDELNILTHVARATLHDKVPAELGDISFQEYKHVAAQQALSHYMGDRIIVPLKDEGNDDAEYRVIPKEDVVSVRVRIVKTLDVK